MLDEKMFALLQRVIFGFGGVCVLASAALAVEAPYTENFDSYPTGSMPNNFSTQTKGGGVFFSSQWNVQNPSGTSGVYENLDSGDLVRTSAAVDVTNLGNSDFLLSTSFVLNSYGVFQPTLTDIRVGLGALGSSSDFSSSGYQFSYLVLENGNSGDTNGSLQIYKGGLFLAASPFVTLPVTLGTTYTMTLMGTYLPSGLVLTGTLRGGSSSISLTTTDPTPPQGSYFGYYDIASGTDNHAAYLDVSYDNFGVSVPEPRITWLLGFGLAIIGICNVSRRQIQGARESIATRKVMTRRSNAVRGLASDLDASGRRGR